MPSRCSFRFLPVSVVILVPIARAQLSGLAGTWWPASQLLSSALCLKSTVAEQIATVQGQASSCAKRTSTPET